MIRTPEYRTAIASRHWRELRARLKQQRGEQCERCRKTWAPGYRTSLQLHHKTYERLGHEREDDVELLCVGCHETADDERAKSAQARAANALSNAQLDGWASRVYGEGWRWAVGEEKAEQDFDAWLERRGEETDRG